MGPIPQGSHNAHINQSYGPDTNIMKFYITENSTKYGKQWENFKPKTSVRHKGTGYLSNFRPGVYYSQRLDEVDNPVMGRIVAKNYHTVTQRDFVPYQENVGNEIFPQHVHQTGTGFIRDNNVIKHTKAGVMSPIAALPSYKPLLHKLKGKDPVEMENHGYGPKYMVSETQEKYQGRPGSNNKRSMIIGQQENTGFTNEYGVEPITYNPSSAYKNDGSEWNTNRPTGYTIMKTDYLPSKYPGGEEKLPNISPEAERGSGFTKEKAKPLYVHRLLAHAYDHANDMPGLRADRLKKKDPAEYLNMIHPNNYSSVNMDIFNGAKKPDIDKLNRYNIGQQERSGFSANNEPLLQIPEDRQRFVTHYMTRFLDETPEGINREGHCMGNLQRQKPDGFTKSTAVHANGRGLDTTSLRDHEPYVARSIKARDPFCDSNIKSALITAA